MNVFLSFGCWSAKFGGAIIAQKIYLLRQFDFVCCCCCCSSFFGCTMAEAGADTINSFVTRSFHFYLLQLSCSGSRDFTLTNHPTSVLDHHNFPIMLDICDSGSKLAKAKPQKRFLICSKNTSSRIRCRSTCAWFKISSTSSRKSNGIYRCSDSSLRYDITNGTIESRKKHNRSNFHFHVDCCDCCARHIFLLPFCSACWLFVFRLFLSPPYRRRHTHEREFKSCWKLSCEFIAFNCHHWCLNFPQIWIVKQKTHKF